MQVRQSAYVRELGTPPKMEAEDHTLNMAHNHNLASLFLDLAKYILISFQTINQFKAVPLPKQNKMLIVLKMCRTSFCDKIDKILKS